MANNLPKVTILMITHNSIPHIIYTIDSIINNTHYPCELLIVESESDDGTDKYCDWLTKHHNNIKVLHTKKEGVIKSFNTGLKHIKEGDVLLTHDDVIFPKLYRKEFLAEFVKFKNIFKDVGLITSLNGGSISGPEYLKGLRWAGTWCTYIPRETLDKVGIFDEGFHPGNGEDIDFSFRVQKIGLKIHNMYFSVDHHRFTEHTSDDSMDVEKIKKKNALYFRKKHNIGDGIK